MSMSPIIISSYVTSWTAFVLIYGCFFPFGVGLLYWPPIICSWEWFPNRKGLISGIVIGSFGFGSSIFSFLTRNIVNPNNVKITIDPSTGEKYFQPDVANNVPHMYRFCSLIWCILLLIAITLISRNEEFNYQKVNQFVEYKKPSDLPLKDDIDNGADLIPKKFKLSSDQLVDNSFDFNIGVKETL